MFKAKPYQIPLLEVDRLIKLGEVEKALARVIYPVPTRPTIIAYCESGILLGRRIGKAGHYHVFQSSLDKFICENQQTV
jgi:hypothetical protein